MSILWDKRWDGRYLCNFLSYCSFLWQ